MMKLPIFLASSLIFSSQFISSAEGQTNISPRILNVFNNAYDCSLKEYENVDIHTIPNQGTLYDFPCYRGAYNLVNVLILDTGKQVIPLNFPYPILNKNSTKIIGWTNQNELINLSIETEKSTVSFFSKSRGLGDAFHSGEYKLVCGKPVLIYFEADDTFDEKINPINVLNNRNQRNLNSNNCPSMVANNILPTGTFQDDDWSVTLTDYNNAYHYYGYNNRTGDSLSLTGAEVKGDSNRKVYIWRNGKYRYEVSWQPKDHNFVRLQVFDPANKLILNRLLSK